DVQLDLAAHVHAGAVDHQDLGHGRGPQPSSAATASISISASGIARFPICTSVLAGGLGPEDSARPPPDGSRYPRSAAQTGSFTRSSILPPPVSTIILICSKMRRVCALMSPLPRRLPSLSKGSWPAT